MEKPRWSAATAESINMYQNKLDIMLKMISPLYLQEDHMLQCTHNISMLYDCLIDS